MPIEYEIKKDLNLAVIRHVGTILDHEFLAKHLEINRAIGPDMDRIIDLRQTDSKSRSAEFVHRIAQMAKQSASETNALPKVAIVAPANLSYGLARMFESYAGEIAWTVVVFREMEKALEWMGVNGESST